jgi:hypothetical protein
MNVPLLLDARWLEWVYRPLPGNALSKFITIVNAWIADMKDSWKETMSCQVTTEACLHSKELNLEHMECEVEHWEVPTKEATVKSLGTMKKWHRSGHLAAGRPGEPNELTQGYCGSWKKLAATCRTVVSCSIGAGQGKRLQENSDLGKLWTAEGIGRSQQEDDLLCKSGTAQGTWASETQSWRTISWRGMKESDHE